MTRPDATQPDAGFDLEQATLRYLDGISEPDEIQTLFQRLEQNPEDRRVFVRLSRQSAAIRERSRTRVGRDRHELLAGGSDVETPGSPAAPPAASPRPQPLGEPSRRWRRRRFAAAAALLLCASVAGLVLYGLLGPSAWPEGRVAKVVAVYRARGAIATDDAPAAFTAGDTLTTEAQAYYHIKTRHGVELYVEGASELTFNRAGEVALTRGGLTANVPESAVGFVVRAPGGELIDLGTQFAAYVDAQGGCVVNVSEGRVQLRGIAGGSPPRDLEAGDAGQLSATGRIATRVGGSGSASVVWGLPGSAHGATLLAMHPAGYLTFDRRDAPILVMNAPAAGDADDAAWADQITLSGGGPLRAPGRYATLSNSDKPVILPGAMASVGPGTGYTFNAWIRPASRASQNVFTVAGPAGPSRSTGPQLRLRPDGIVEHVGPGGRAVQRATRPIRLKQWTMVTMTMDANLRMRLYLNGVEAGAAAASPIDRSISMTDLAIGGPAGQRRGVSHHMFAFAGGLDELVWFGRALSAQEVERVFRSRDE